MTRLQRTSALATLILTGVAVLSGCGGAAEQAADQAPPPAQATTSPAEEDCGDVAATVRKHLSSSDVSDVIVEGQCTTVVIATELDDEDTATGKELCEAAGKVAYTGDINSVNVVSKAGTELSTGIPGASCLP
ncbi:hypothetical protein ACWEOZ_12430 [Actinoplanes sp. NPDC004185]